MYFLLPIFQQEQEKKKIDWHDYKAIAEDEQRQGNGVSLLVLKVQEDVQGPVVQNKRYR